ncbi:hydroxyacid dehydrogenase [Sporomusa sp.]|uniref:hydroxyacid dehydrogenase n=1 Tax=Sporomusa sp. TaxID=2078658 RepID=UPI002BACF47E|nr:hydroxyacid dehydrogenase [Sporomusa sp.]HWR09471.1 hydroxyacid dehydrogenase [Sporomusa sp.]
MTKVLLVEPVHESGMRILQQAGLEVVVSPSTDTETLIDLVKDDVFGIIIRTSQLESRVLEAGRQLRIIGRHGIGVNNIDLAAADSLNILVANVPDANAYSVAEYVITAAMMLSRKMVQGDTALRTGKLIQTGASLPGLVKRFNLGGNELPGRCMGIIGLGKIGLQIALMAAGILHMEVLAYDPYRSEVPSGITLVADVNEIYRQADFITLNTPLTKETENMINAATLGMMKPAAYLINAGRGELIDEQALAAALIQGNLAGAALDVFREEPPRLSNPLFHAPNVFLTPHVAGSTDEAVERLAIGSAQAIADWFCGRKPGNIINPQVWERLVK